VPGGERGDSGSLGDGGAIEVRETLRQVDGVVGERELRHL
jgi:hypothetical protein